MASWIFKDRRDAGRQLARALFNTSQHPDLIILALPRGGVPVAYEVGLALKQAIDVLIVRKLGVPAQPELAFGAITSAGVRILNQAIVDHAGLSAEQIDRVEQRERLELARREQDYRGERPPLRCQGKHIILIDDGIATGASMKAALQTLKLTHPLRITIAVPCAAKETCQALAQEATMICLQQPEPFMAVGKWYQDFSQTSDEEVRRLLAQDTTSGS